MSQVTKPLTTAVKGVSSIAESIGKDIVAVVGIVGSVLAAAGGIIPADVALYVTAGIAVLRSIGEDLEKQ